MQLKVCVKNEYSIIRRNITDKRNKQYSGKSSDVGAHAEIIFFSSITYKIYF